MGEYIKREDVMYTLKKANIGGYITERLLEIPSTDVLPVVGTENMAIVPNEFICKKCGIYLKNHTEVVMDEDNDGYVDEQHCNYEPKFCPECGAKVESHIKTPKRDKPLYTMDEICKMNGVEFKGSEPNEDDRSREILFRGKDLETGKWLYGNFIKTPNHAHISTSGEAFPVKVEPKTISQYTGLTDRNGVKIFEGDIVRIGRYFSNIYTADDYVCRYDTTTASFKFYYIIPEDIADVNKYAVLGDGETLSGMGRGFVIENVVSNIYDNINYAE